MFIKADGVAEYIGRKLGLPADLIRSPEEQQQIVQQMQQMQQAAQLEQQQQPQE
jgi:flavin-dependent dehydrogenase